MQMYAYNARMKLAGDVSITRTEEKMLTESFGDRRESAATYLLIRNRAVLDRMHDDIAKFLAEAKGTLRR